MTDKTCVPPDAQDTLLARVYLWSIARAPDPYTVKGRVWGWLWAPLWRYAERCWMGDDG